MIAVGLTGGIGSGKSTVAALLAGYGAVVIDADAAAREALGAGTPGAERVRERFGEHVTHEDGSIDRRALAAVVFSDPSARADLEAIVHPVVHDRMLERLAVHRDSGAVVVLEVPLLAEVGRERYPLDGVLVVDCPTDIAIERLETARTMSRADAEARIAAQVDRMARVRIADFVIMNMGTKDELVQMVGEAWRWISRLGVES